MAAQLTLNPAHLRERRLLAGLTQTRLAAKVGVHPISIARYETSLMNPRPDTISRIARALGVEITDLAAVTDA